MLLVRSVCGHRLPMPPIILSVAFVFFFFFFFFNATATTEIYTLSLHDALPILVALYEGVRSRPRRRYQADVAKLLPLFYLGDRKSTRLNSSHLGISYAVFCLKKKKKYKNETNSDQL